MTLDRMKLSAQTVRDNIAIMEECEEPDDAGYYLQLEHEKFVLDCIEKQIPKKVNISLKGTTGWNTKCHCPNCHSMVSHGKYCANSGQALDFNSNGSDTE